MKISFVGCPLSGKTTLAAKLFVHLKTREVPCELLLEQARLHIARLRHQSPGRELRLTDEQQHEIMRDQLGWEAILERPGVVLVTDSSPLNTLLYLEDLELWYVRKMTEESVRNAGLVFYCPPVPEPPGTPDPNRVHDSEQRELVHRRVMPVLAKHAPDVLERMVYLGGSLDERFATVLATFEDSYQW